MVPFLLVPGSANTASITPMGGVDIGRQCDDCGFKPLLLGHHRAQHPDQRVPLQGQRAAKGVQVSVSLVPILVQ
jgi:hypothetical protein